MQHFQRFDLVGDGFGDGAAFEQAAVCGLGRRTAAISKAAAANKTSQSRRFSRSGSDFLASTGWMAARVSANCCSASGAGTESLAILDFYGRTHPFLQIKLPVGKAGLLRQRTALQQENNPADQQTNHSQPQRHIADFVVVEERPYPGHRCYDHGNQQSGQQPPWQPKSSHHADGNGRASGEFVGKMLKILIHEETGDWRLEIGDRSVSVPSLLPLHNALQWAIE